MAISHDPVIVEHARTVWNRVWDNAVPHMDYVKE